MNSVKSGLFLNRLLASVVDFFVVTMATWTLFLIAVGLFHWVSIVSSIPIPMAWLDNPVRVQVVEGFLFFCIYIFYYAYCTFLYGKTVGKYWLRLKVEGKPGCRPTRAQAFVRAGSQLLSHALGGIGYWMYFLQGQGRTLHDRVSGTRVIQS